MSLIVLRMVLSMWRLGKCSSKSLNVKILSSFFRRSALSGPTPFRYSIGLSNMLLVALMGMFSTKIMGKELAGHD